MQRPKGVLIIGALCGFAAIYLCGLAAILLISPGTISLMAGKYFLYGLQLAGPYMMLIGAGIYGIVGWGLFRLQNWARWVAMLMIALSVGPLIAQISMAELGVAVFWYGLQIALRAAAGWYLAQAPSVIDAFTQQRHGQRGIFTDNSRNRYP
jgi:hypothetical protein